MEDFELRFFINWPMFAIFLCFSHFSRDTIYNRKISN